MIRDICEICKSKDLIVIEVIEKMPVRIGTSETNSNYKFNDLIYAKCEVCNNVQILDLANPIDVYAENHNQNIVGQTWVKHNKAFSEFISNEIKDECKIFEIGDPSAKIASIIIDNDKILSWDIIEPQARQIDLPKVNMIDGFFDKNFASPSKYDMIILSHVFEHLTNLHDLIPTMSSILNESGRIIISVPNMQKILEQQSMPPLHMTFEHTIFLNKINIEEFFKQYNFSLKSFEKFNDHSDFYIFIKNKNLNYNFKNLMPKDLSQNVKEIINFKKIRINNFYEEYKKNDYDACFIYGSHVHSQMYLNLGIEEEILNGVLDNDIAKHYKYLYGTNLKVFPVDVLKQFRKPLLLCDMGAYDNEIKIQIKENYPKTFIV